MTEISTSSANNGYTHVTLAGYACVGVTSKSDTKIINFGVTCTILNKDAASLPPAKSLTYFNDIPVSFRQEIVQLYEFDI